jgi:uncharacterized protein YkwD
LRSAASLTLALAALLAAFVAVPDVASAAASPKLDPVERSIIRAVNRARARHGLGPVRANRRLSRAANAHTKRMLHHDFFAHGAFAQRVRGYVSYNSIGEALAHLNRCRNAAGRIVGMWMNSPPHRAILLSGRFGRIGIGRRWGRLGSSNSCVVTADFASRS